MGKLNTPEAQLEDSKPVQSLPAALSGQCLHWRRWLKSESVKRNLTANMKTLGDTMTKQNQNFKQPQNEKEEIQKELQKVKAGACGGRKQKLDGF